MEKLPNAEEARQVCIPTSPHYQLPTSTCAIFNLCLPLISTQCPPPLAQTSGRVSFPTGCWKSILIVRALLCTALPFSPQTVFKIPMCSHCQSLSIFTTTSLQTTGTTSLCFNCPGPQNSFSLVGMDTSSAAASFHPGPESLCHCLAFKVAPKLASVFPTPPQLQGSHLVWGLCLDV